MDHQGSIIEHSNSSATVLQTNAYDPYGIPKTTNDGRFGYTGQTWLPQLGLNYYKARIYSPKLGRFLQTDPIFYKDDFNLYAYVSNDPANATDPTGKYPFATGRHRLKPSGQHFEVAGHTRRIQSEAEFRAAYSGSVTSGYAKWAGDAATTTLKQAGNELAKQTLGRVKGYGEVAAQIPGLGRFELKGNIDLAGNVDASVAFASVVEGDKPINYSAGLRLTVYGDPNQESVVSTSVQVMRGGVEVVEFPRFR